METMPAMPQVPTTNQKAAPRRAPVARLGRDAAVAAICGLVAVLMVGASYAAVPFYNWFCRATGFNGTTQVATAAPAGGPPARQNAARVRGHVSAPPPRGIDAAPSHVAGRRRRD